MTRMFKQIVESSRKKLTKAVASPALVTEQSQPRLAALEPQRKPDFEPLESRVLFSGVGSGFNKKSVTFTDAWGDTVLVKLIGGPAGAKFDITLDGGAKNKADIQNITINGKATASTILDVFVKPNRMNLSSVYTGGNITTPGVGDPIYAVTKTNQIFTPGFVEIGTITATTDLRGITMNGADFANISVQGNIGLGSQTIHSVTHALHGGIAVDIGNTQFRSGLLNDPVGKIDFGNISVTGGVDSLILQGRSTTPSTNNLGGTISIGGAIGTFDARFSDILTPLSFSSLGNAFFHDVLANVTSAGAIGKFTANNLVADLSSAGTVSGLALSGSLLGTASALGFTSVSVNGNFTGLLQSTGVAGIGNVIINSGTAFTGTIEAQAGNIGSVTLAQAATPFSGHIKADVGNITGPITAGFFSNAAIEAPAGSVGAIISNATAATVSSGIANTVVFAGAGGIGNITSVASITNSQFEAVGGAIGNVTVVQGGITGLVLGGSTTTLASSIGNITANLSISGLSAIASGAIGNVTSIAGFIGGSANTATFITPGIVVSASFTGTPLSGTAIIAIQGGQPGPKADVFIGGSIGNISALGDISGNVINATAGNVGNITSHEGRIAFDSVVASGNIGNIYANSQDATFAFDSAGNVLQSNSDYIHGTAGTLGTTYSLVPSGSAIDHSAFVAGGTIGTITARSSATGTYHPTGTSSTSYVPNRAIDTSLFNAATGIGNIYAFAANTVYHAPSTTTYVPGVGSGSSGTTVTTSTHLNGVNAAIYESNFIVTATSGATGIGNVRAIANGGPAIYYSTLHALSGNIGNVYGRSVLSNAIYGTTIETDLGNIGIVKGIVTGGNGAAHNFSDGIEHSVINAGSAPGGTGSVAGVVGQSTHNNGIDNTKVYAGSGGIGYVTGISTGIYVNPSSGHAGVNGINDSTFVTTGNLGNVTGQSSGDTGIQDSTFHAAKIGNVLGTSSGYDDGIEGSKFFAMHGIGNITGVNTSPIGGNGIEGSYANANVAGTGAGAIGNITGTTTGPSSGIEGSNFYGVGIGNIVGTSNNAIAGSGIIGSKFHGDSTLTGLGAIGTVTGTTYGAGGFGITGSTFTAGAGVGNITGNAFGAYSASGIDGTTVNADDAHIGTSAIGTIVGVSKAQSGAASGITGSTFTAGASIGNVLGTTTAPGDESYGIADSQFYAAAGTSSQTAHNGTIGSVTGTSYANGAVGDHGGIAGSTFVAGGGPSSYGTIGNVLGVSKVNGQGSVRAYGISGSSFTAGSGGGKIGAVTGTALAEGGLNEEGGVTAIGISGSTFLAGTGEAQTAAGTIGVISGYGKAESAFGAATAYGVSGSTITAGSSGAGNIGNISGTAEAYAHTTAIAKGISGSTITASPLSLGVGVIGTITGAATADSQGLAYARGISGSTISSGYANGTIGTITATANATGEGTTDAYGIIGSTITTGFGVGGKGSIGAIAATAKADANGGAVNADGIYTSTIKSGYTNGTITSITTTGIALTYSGASSAYGINESTISAGFGFGGVGNIGNVKGTASATSSTGSALAYGLVEVGLSSGLSQGAVGNVYGTATATVIGSTAAVSANAYGLDFTDVTAGFNGINGVIGKVAGSAIASATSTLNSTANAIGIDHSNIEAAAVIGATVAPDNGVGSIGAVTGYGKATAIGLNATARGIGIYSSNIVAADGDFGNGTITSVYGRGIAVATVNTSNESTASAYAAGIGKDSSIYAGNGYKSKGLIGTVYGKATANATALGNGNDVATSTALGIFDTNIYAGALNQNSYGKVGNVTGYANAVSKGGQATSTAKGLSHDHIHAGSSQPVAVAGYNGIIGNVTGTATANSASTYANAVSTAIGIHEADIQAANGALGNGKIGTVNGSGIATSVASGNTGNATATGTGIDPTTIYAGSNTPATGSAAAGNGYIAGITGKGYAYATTNGKFTTGTTTGFGINGLNVLLGVAGTVGNPATSAFAGTGTIKGGIIGNAKAYTTVPTSGYGYATATGIANLKVELSDAYGVGYAVAKNGSLIGGLSAVANAKVNSKATPADKATVKTYGFNNVGIYVSNATSGNAKGNVAKAANGTIGGISQTQSASAYAGGPDGVANATASPISTLNLSAANASGYFAYSGIGTVAKGSQIYGHAIAYASGYNAKATGTGLAKVYVNAGNASSVNGYARANPGESYVGELDGKANVKAYAKTTAGNRTAGAYAYGINLAKINVGNATGLKYAHGGYGYINAIYGYANAKAIADSAFNATATSNAYGLKAITANAGNATTSGTGASKPTRGVIGKGAAEITGLAYAGAYANPGKVGLNALATATAKGTDAVTLNAGNAIATGSGYAKANLSYGHIYTIEGKGYAKAYAYGKIDPKAVATGDGIFQTYAYAGNATSNSGPAAAGKGLIDGFDGYAKGYAKAKGAAPVTAYGVAHGIDTIVGNSGDAISTGGNSATGGTGYEGLVGGNYGIARAYGKAYSNPVTTAISGSPALSHGYAIGVLTATFLAGDGLSSAGAGTATGSVGHIGGVTGLATGTAYSLGDYANSFAQAYGQDGVTARAAYGYSLGANATGGTGIIAANIGATYSEAPAGFAAGEFLGTGIANAQGIGVKTTNATARGYGVGINAAKNILINAGSATIGTATVATATAGPGTIGNFVGTGTATSYATTTAGGPTPSAAGTATSLSGGVKNDYVYAGNATAPAGTAIAAPGVIGTVTGTGTSKATGFTSSAISFGIDPSKFYAGVAIGSAVATGGASGIGSFNGSGYAKSYGLNATGHGYGILNVRVYGGTATATGAFGDATGGNATAGAESGTVTVNVKGTAATTNVIGYGDGIHNDRIRLGNAVGYYAYAGTGSVGDLNGKAVVTVTGYTSNGAYVADPRSRGIEGTSIRAGIALGTTGANSVATGNTGKAGNITGYGKGVATGATVGGGKIVVQDTYGLFLSDTNHAIELGYASGATATAGAATLLNVLATGYGAASSVGTTSGNIATVDIYGTDNLGIHAGDATAGSAANGIAKGSTFTIGTLTGSATSKATGTSTGGVIATYGVTDGIQDENIFAGNAYGKKAANAGSGTIGATNGTGTTTVNGTTTNNHNIYATDTHGINRMTIVAGQASTGSTTAGTAVGAQVTIGGFATNATANVTGKTDVNGGNVYATEIYGIRTLSITGGNALGYKATAGNAYIAKGASITGAATANVSGSTANATSAVNAGGSSNGIYGIYNLTISGGVASGSNAKSGVATGGTTVVGGISGAASGIVTETGTKLGGSLAYAYGIKTLAVTAGNASGATATAGAGTVGNLAGKGTATSGNAIATGTVTSHAYGLYGLTISAGIATSLYAKGIATGGASTIGTTTGGGYSTAVASLTNVAAVANATGIGISKEKAYAGNASSSYKAYAGTGAVGTLTGTGSATATAFTSTALSKGIDPIYLGAGNANNNGKISTNVPKIIVSYAAGSIGKGAAGTIGDLLGYATANATGGVATPGSATANSYGVFGVTVTAGDAVGYSSTAGSGTVANTKGVVGKANSTASAYTAKVVNTYGIKGLTIKAANAYGSTLAKGSATAATATIGSLAGTSTALLTGNNIKASGYATTTGIVAGIYNVSITGGYANGTGATGGSKSSIGGINGQNTTTADAYKVKLATNGGIDNVSVNLGSVYGPGVIKAGNSLGIANGGQIYGKSTVNAKSDGLAATNKGSIYTSSDFGIFSLNLTAGTAQSSSGVANKAYGGSSTIGNIAGVSIESETTTAGASATVDFGATGAAQITIHAGNAYGIATAQAGTATIGNVSGKATANFQGGLPGTTVGTGNVYGLGYSGQAVHIYAGQASTVGATGVAKGAAATLGTLTGYGFAYATGAGKTAAATAYAYGVRDVSVLLGNANGYTATAATGGVGNVYGKAKADAIGFGSGTGARGVDALSITASGATAGAGIASVGTGAAGTVGNITGYADAYATGNNDGATSTVYGIRNNSVTLGIATGTKANQGTGVIGAIKVAVADAYAYDTVLKNGTAHAYGIEGSTFNAAYSGATASSIGKVTGYAVASYKPGGVTGTNSTAYGIGKGNVNTNDHFLSGGTIVGLYSKGTAFGLARGTAGTTAHALGAVTGNIKAYSVGAGSNVFSDGLDFSTFIATSFGNLYAGSDSTSAGATGFYQAKFGASNGSIGNIKAVRTGANLKGLGGSTVFTALNNIGNINVTGYVSTAGQNGFFAGLYLGSNFAIDAGDAHTANASIGTVTITGGLNNTDIIASIISGTGTSFGNSTDTSNGGTIGAINIGKPANPATSSGTNQNFAIEAHSINGGANKITWGTTANNIDANNAGNGTNVTTGYGGTIRVRTI